ncbi:DUF4105 domain-containing protein [Ravibacter arvi]|uniref:lipoprotein N-acyltransferase Lnb domain-containing protein n=1 Tax=Ravibacter arvi TaxID=2051041 RepID=UPI0031E71F34
MPDSKPFRFLPNTCVAILCFFLLFAIKKPLRAQVPDSTTQVSLITVGPGDDLYSSFGHSLFWFNDQAKGVDASYNYGGFSFQTENFYLKFLRGTLPYKIDKYPLAPQVYGWQYENRSVTLQVLNLTIPQKQRLYALLEENLLPQNQEYHYRFFYDNCATRLQDLLIKVCGDSLRYEGYPGEQKSFREWIDQYAYRQKPWADFGMDLAIGKPADKEATPMQATFLPDNLHDAFAAAQVIINGKPEPLVKGEQVIFKAAPRAEPGFLTPKVFFWLLALLAGLLTLWQIKKNKIQFTFDKILFSLCGIAGIVLLALWVGTDHEDTVLNWDILWANPLLFFIAGGLSARVRKPWISIALIVYAVFLIAGTINIDKHNQVLIPILLTLVIRIYYINKTLPKIPTS